MLILGVRLVGAAYHPHWAAHLTYAERVILCAIAMSALDTPSRGKPSELYWGGEEALVIALDGDLPERHTASYRTRTDAVKKIIAGLVRKRALVRETEGRRGTKAVYRLTLDSYLQPTLLDPQPVDNSLRLIRSPGNRGVLTTPQTAGITTPLTGT